jgi:hypothetical protein
VAAIYEYLPTETAHIVWMWTLSLLAVVCTVVAYGSMMKELYTEYCLAQNTVYPISDITEQNIDEPPDSHQLPDSHIPPDRHHKIELKRKRKIKPKLMPLTSMSTSTLQQETRNNEQSYGECLQTNLNNVSNFVN